VSVYSIQRILIPSPDLSENGTLENEWDRAFRGILGRLAVLDDFKRHTVRNRIDRSGADTHGIKEIIKFV
jgi:hypothetical protein